MNAGRDEAWRVMDAMNAPRAVTALADAMPRPGEPSSAGRENHRSPAIHAAPAIHATGVAVGRAGPPVLARIDLAVAAGERIALVGANGSGKTTLLRALAGLDLPLAGTIRWSGQPLPRGSRRVQAVGVLFQGEPAARFTVRELVTLGLGLDEPPSRAARLQVDAALAQAALTGLADRSCATLSGGEAQRALVARAMVAEPRAMVLDEPTNHLDPAGRAMIHALLDRLRGRVAVVIATHELELAATCDRVVLLHAGGVAALGAPADVLTPARLAAALGVHVRRLDDPDGGPPLFRVVGPCAEGAALSADRPATSALAVPGAGHGTPDAGPVRHSTTGSTRTRIG
jgi:iron complex transport system ATP-binding protein